jgi:hypothetical protein
MSSAECSTCGSPLVWIIAAVGRMLVCPKPCCPGHRENEGGER